MKQLTARERRLDFFLVRAYDAIRKYQDGKLRGNSTRRGILTEPLTALLDEIETAAKETFK